MEGRMAGQEVEVCLELCALEKFAIYLLTYLLNPLWNYYFQPRLMSRDGFHVAHKSASLDLLNENSLQWVNNWIFIDFSRRDEENHKFKYLKEETWGNLFPSSFICLRFIDIWSSGRQGVVFYLLYLSLERMERKESRKINLNTRVTGSSSHNPGKWIGWRWWFNKDIHSVRSSSSALPCNWMDGVLLR